jgi:hypothetical protein
VIALALSLALAASTPNPYLEEAKALYGALDFERCLERLSLASKKWSSTPKEQFEIEVYAGLARFNLGQVPKATQHFRVAQRIDPEGELPAYSSPKAVDLWNQVKQSLDESTTPFAETDLPEDAPKKAELTPPPKVEEPSPLAPVQWKRHAAPLALSVVSFAALAVGIGLGISAKSLEAQANAATWESDFVRIGNSASANAFGANVAYGVAAASAIAAGILWWTQSKPPDADAPR